MAHILAGGKKDMSLANRLTKLDRSTRKRDLVLITVNEGETNEEAYQQCFRNDRIKPKKVLYLTPLDLLL